MTDDALLADQLDEWNNLADELSRLYVEYGTGPRVHETAGLSCAVYNSVSWRAREMTYALVGSRSNEAGEHVLVLRFHVERFRDVLERDPALPGSRTSGGLDAPNLRLLTTPREVREAYRQRQHKGPVVVKPEDATS
jgi:hypothetical protein